MPYIGKSPVAGGFHKLDNLTASATATYALTLGGAAYYPESANQLLVSLNGVIQAPQDSFTVSGSNIVFDSALTASDSIDFIVALGDVIGVGSVTDGAITTAKLGNGAVTSAKLGNGAVTSAKLDTNIAVSGNVDVGGNLLVDTIKDGAGTATAMTIDSSGRISTPNVIAWRVKKTNGDAGTGLITFNLSEINQGSAYSGTRMTAPIAGIYLVSFTGRHDSQTATHCEFLKNGTAFLGFRSTSTGGVVGNVGIGATAIVDLAVNDYVEVSVVSGTVEGDNTAEGAIFTGHFVG